MQNTEAPTPTSKKYSDYSVTVHESARRRSVAEAQLDNSPILVYVTAYRVPSLKEFQVYIRSDATAEERHAAVDWASCLARGAWDRSPAVWYRTRRDGRQAWHLSIGRSIADPLIELEVELMEDNDVDFELRALLAVSK